MSFMYCSFEGGFTEEQSQREHKAGGKAIAWWQKQFAGVFRLFTVAKKQFAEACRLFAEALR